MSTPGSWDPLDHLVTVSVAAVSPREVEVKLADGRPGVIAADDFAGRTPPAVGDELEAVMLTRDDPRGRPVLSHAVAVKARAWRDAGEAHESKEPIRGVVTAATKGGYVVDVGVRAFLPASMAQGDREEERDLVGEEIEALVVDLDRERDRLVISRREMLRRADRQLRREVLASLREGERVAAPVAEVADFGLLLDLGGVRGLVPRSELDWDPRRSPTSVAKVGQEVEALVLDVRPSKGRVRLSIKKLSTDPFTLVTSGERVAGRVLRVVEYGAFIELADGELVGLCHRSELSQDPGARPDEVVVPGDEVMVKILSIDRRKRRVGLSVVQGMWG